MLVAPESKFVKVKCEQCKNEQIIFNKASTEIKCLVCDKVIGKPTGGKIRIDAKLIGVIE